MDAGWAAVLVAFGSFLLAGVAAVVASRAAGYAKGQRDATERQAVAAEAQVEVMRRQVELMERPPAVEASVGSVRGAPYVPPWSVFPTGKHGFALANGGVEPAFDVSIEFDQDPARAEPTQWSRIDARSQVRVLIFRAMGASPDTVTVRWRRAQDGELLEWTTAVP